jgi:hypothetical protein
MEKGGATGDDGAAARKVSREGHQREARSALILVVARHRTDSLAASALFVAACTAIGGFVTHVVLAVVGGVMMDRLVMRLQEVIATVLLQGVVMGTLGLGVVWLLRRVRKA